MCPVKSHNGMHCCLPSGPLQTLTAKHVAMVRSKTVRTFTACWTCRQRNIGCDTALPSCSQCRRSRITCEGYHFQLVWVDPDTGDYHPYQRRSYPCHSTWASHPKWTRKDIDHLIRNCDLDEEMKCRCKLHFRPNPFTAFAQSPGSINLAEVDEVQLGTNGSSSPKANSFVDVVVGDEPRSWQGRGQTISGEQNHSNLIVWSQEDLSSTPIPEDISQNKSSERMKSNRNLHRRRCVSAVRPTNSIRLCPAQSTPFLNNDATHDERRVFHHFLSYLAKGMIPVRDERNPWETVYPSLAMRSTRSTAARALYHGLLAQSAHHLANLKGAERGAQESATAVRQYGIALHLLRRSLFAQYEDYSSVLAAIYTVLLTEHVFQGSSTGWQNHIRGARSFVKRYLNKQPWKSSQEAFIITQNFALSVLVSSTVDHAFLTSTATVDETSDFDNLLHDLVATPLFGYTLGGTTHMLVAMNRIRLLEAHRRAKYGDVEQLELDSDIIAEVDEILHLCHVPLTDKVEVYMAHRLASGVTVDFRMRALAEIHLRLFNNAILIYLLCNVLRYPPSLVASEVLQVLNDAAAFTDMHGKVSTVSIWPLFVAAAEAHTLEAQALATHCLTCSIGSGVGNRHDAVRVIYQVWSDRSELARERQCRPGDVSIDWRQVMHRLHTYILLL